MRRGPKQCVRESIFQHPVADAQLGEDIFGIGGILLELAADVGHVHPEDLIAGAAVGAPDVLQNEIIGENLARMDAQKLQNLELVLGEVDLLPVQQHLVLGDVHGQILDVVHILLGALGTA